jgi:hypothetical protein
LDLRQVFDDPTMAFAIEKTELTRGNSYKLVPYQGEVRGPAMETFGSCTPREHRPAGQRATVPGSDTPLCH